MSPSKTAGKLKFLLDENVDIRVASFLKAQGYPVTVVPKGTTDKAVALLARDSQSALVTLDADFDNPVVFPPGKFSGIIVLRVHPPRLVTLTEALTHLFSEITPAELSGKLCIVSEFGVEIVTG